MSKRLLFTKTKTRLAPAEPDAEEWLSRLKDGAEVWIDRPKRARNTQHHRLFMKLLHECYANLPEAAQERYPTFERFRKSLLIYMGYCDTWWLKDGQLAVDAQSIAFDKMDQNEFDRLWNDALTVIERDILPGVHRKELEEFVREVAQ